MSKQVLKNHGNFSRVTTPHFELEVHNDGRVYIVENANIVRVDIDELRKALNTAEQDQYKGGK